MTNDEAIELGGIEAKMILAEHANMDVATGKANLLGAGLSALPAGPSEFFVVIFLSIPARNLGQHAFRLELVDDQGKSDIMPALEGNFEIQAEGNEGPITPSFPMGVRMMLPPDRSFEWRLWLDGQTHSSWRAGFRTMP